jgi:hypothetical protein
MNARWLSVVATIVTLLGPPAIHAQGRGVPRWGQDVFPRDGACFYQDINFRGQYFCAAVGQDVSGVPVDMNDRISSVRLFGRADVTVFRDARFRGASARFGTSVRDLRAEGWNDRLSSFRVRAGSWSGGGRPPEWGNPQPNAGACFFSEPNFRGQRFCMPRGASYSEMPPGFNDRISSIQLRGNSTVMLFRDRDFRGASARVNRDLRSLGGTWSDIVSSIRVF